LIGNFDSISGIGLIDKINGILLVGLALSESVNYNKTALYNGIGIGAPIF